ncbi:MAG: class I SAM-dependent methyltransferase, partial [Actinomycetota bacterium]
MADEPKVNVEQTRDWDGPAGDNWTENDAFYTEASRYTTPVLFDAAAIASQDRVLDVGCGTGQTTRAAARAASAGRALGIDLSSRMLERARERAAAEGIANVSFVRGDAQVYPFEPGSCSVAISRFGVMFFDDPVAAFTNIGRALAPGGRLAMLCWRELGRNEWVSAIFGALAAGRDLPTPPPNAPSPFALADAGRVREILGAAGFTDVELDEVERPTYFGPDAARSFDGVRKLGIVNGLLADLDDRARAAALDSL